MFRATHLGRLAAKIRNPLCIALIALGLLGTGCKDGFLSRFYFEVRQLSFLEFSTAQPLRPDPQ